MKIDIEEVARRAGCAPAAAQLVLDGLRLGIAERRVKSSASSHISSKELCDAIVCAARLNHNSAVRDTLMQAGIHRSENVGQIVFSLIEQGLCGKQEGESIADFDDLFVTTRDL